MSLRCAIRNDGPAPANSSIYYGFRIIRSSNEDTTPPIIPPMELIPQGTFRMGDCNDGGFHAHEIPIHSVYTDAYYIGKYEITFEEYGAFCIVTGRNFPSDEGWGRGQRPAININWNDAVAYCNWLSDQAGFERAYDSGSNINIIKKGFRLPTEAEWEKAARGGLVDTRYTWGNIADTSMANYRSFKTEQIGQYLNNNYNLYDMAGNIQEWVSDWYDSNYYNYSPSNNPVGPTNGSYKIVRGGAWLDDYYCIRISNRVYAYPIEQNSTFGFRIARTP